MNVVPSAAADSAPPAELVVQNGRMKGARRTLTGPMTLIGQGQDCEVRLNVDGIQSLHCLLVHSRDGYVIRDLAGDGSTLVNDRSVVGDEPLQDGDRIGIGPFQFQIQIPENARSENLKQMAAALKSERDALRIQAAAVAAQQAGLTEEEIRLDQRRVALQKQEQQLAARLHDRQQELRQLEESVHQEQASVEANRLAEAEHLHQAREELDQSRAQQEKLASELSQERQRLTEMRQRFKRRLQALWSQRREEFERRDRTLTALQTGLQIETGKLEQERFQLNEARLRLNGEIELGRRLLQDEWRKLCTAQEQWETTYRATHEDLSRRRRETEKREEAIAQAIQVLQQREGEEQPSQQAATTAIVPIATGEGHEDVAESLKRIAGFVADQRWHLLEQWQRLLRVQRSWEQGHGTALTELEGGSRRLQEREVHVQERAQQLLVQERLLEARLDQLQERQQALSQLRCSLEGWQARLKLQEASWHAEREEILSSVRAREEALAAQRARADHLHRRRTKRFKQFAADLDKAQIRCVQVRRQYLALWKACQQQQQALLAEQQNVTCQTAALERFRMECISQGDDPVATEKRLERLHRSGASQSAEALRQIEREREALSTQMSRLDERARWLEEREKALAAQTQAIAGQFTELEDQHLARSESDAQRTEETQRAQLQQRLAQQQAQELRQEVERLARMLLDEADASGPLGGRAA